jgi:hypothetical protein
MPRVKSITVIKLIMRQDIDFQRTLKHIISELSNLPYDNGDISDIGNEVGIAIGTIISDISEEEINDFVSGVRHGISLINGTY